MKLPLFERNTSLKENATLKVLEIVKVLNIKHTEKFGVIFDLVSEKEGKERKK